MTAFLVPFPATVKIRRPADVDGFGDPTGPAVEHEIPGCATWPSSAGTENMDFADTVMAPVTLLAPAGSDIRATDEVILDGLVWQVDGDPEVFRSPLTGAGLVQVHLRKVTG